jgi:hypothetical protein
MNALTSWMRGFISWMDAPISHVRAAIPQMPGRILGIGAAISMLTAPVHGNTQAHPSVGDSH